MRLGDVRGEFPSAVVASMESSLLRAGLPTRSVMDGEFSAAFVYHCAALIESAARGYLHSTRPPLFMASLLSRLTGSSPKYEPLQRFCHISCRVGSKVVVQGGRTKDFSEKSRQHLSSVIEIFDPYFELWEQRQVTGDAPLPGTYVAASASLHDDLFSFGGSHGRQRFNTVHRLDTEKLCWSQVSPQNADEAPMPKFGCGMIAFGNSLGVFGGHGVPRGPTEPQSFIKNTRYTDGIGWTNEFHIYNLSEGNMR